MKVLHLLDELEDIIENSSGLPLTGKILVDGSEILEIIKEIRIELPDEIEQAQWIKEERQRILAEAKKESELLMKNAKTNIESMVENDDLSIKARLRAEEILSAAEKNAEEMKNNALEYVDQILGDLQNKMDKLNATYIDEMFGGLQRNFDNITNTINENRNEIKNMFYKSPDFNEE
ncbi:MAG: ATPase [Peptostreptococcales bacterium]|jgi:vacuolar-type H+-ATPase subunit H